jgi:hypothetical protein
MNETQLTEAVGAACIPGYGPDEVVFMGQTVWKCRPQVVFDWGTNRGSSAWILHEATADFDWEPNIHTIDLPNDVAPDTKDHAGVHTGMFLKNCRRVVQWRGDGLETALRLHDGKMRALFFIDGDHSAATVWKELLKIEEAAPTATLLLHDTNQPGGPWEAVQGFRLYTARYNIVSLRSNAGMVRLFPREDA